MWFRWYKSVKSLKTNPKTVVKDMIYNDEVNEDGILKDEIIETCTTSLFKKINNFVSNNLKAHSFRSDIELDGHGLLCGVNEVKRVGDNLIMLRNGMTICALVIDFEMPELDTLLNAGIQCIWIDCNASVEDFIDCVNGSGVSAHEVAHSISYGIFDGVEHRGPQDRSNPFDF